MTPETQTHVFRQIEVDVFGDGDMAAAVIDRIVHHGRILRFHGESYRNKHSLMK